MAKRTPIKVHKDARGHTLQVGTRVAFNYSGAIAIGTIEKITSEFHIRRDTHMQVSYGGAPNPISRVKNSYSMLAIFEVEDIEKASRELRRQALDDFAKANKDVLRLIRDAWDLDELHIFLEEKYGKNWKDDLD